MYFFVQVIVKQNTVMYVYLWFSQYFDDILLVTKILFALGEIKQAETEQKIFGHSWTAVDISQLTPRWAQC